MTASQIKKAKRFKAKQVVYEKKRKMLERKLSLAATPRKEASIKRRLVKLDKRVDALHKRMDVFFKKATKKPTTKSLRPRKKTFKSAKAIIKKSRAERIARVQKLREKKAPKSVYGKDAQAKVKLNDAQISAGSKFMAASNLACLKDDPKNMKQLNEAWRYCQFSHGSEGIEIDDERKDWEKKLRKGDSFTVKELQKRIPWLFDAEIAGK